MTYEEMKHQAAEKIVEAAKFSALCGLNAKDFKIEVSASLYFNVRDAIFHYKAMCDYMQKEDNEGAIRNYNNLMEHILRGEKDAIILQAQNISNKVTLLMQSQNFNYDYKKDDVKKIQYYFHLLKKVILDIRLEGIGLSGRMDSLIVQELKKVSEYTIAIDKICKEYGDLLF